MLFELAMRPIVKEAKSTATRGGVVNNLGHHRVVFAEIEFVTYADFSCRVNEDIPKTHVGIEFTKQENLDACTRFLLVAKQTSREHLGVVEEKNIVFIEVIEDSLELDMLDFATISVDDH